MSRVHDDVTPVHRIGPSSIPAREWFAQLWAHRGVVSILARADFQVRFKRASLGVLWAVVVPVLQALVLAVVFSRLGVDQSADIERYGVFVLSGVIAWSYWAPTVTAGSTAIVDGTRLSDKVWFPRAVLPLVACVAGLVTLGISVIVLIVAMPLFGATPSVALLLLVPAVALLALLTSAVTLVLSALHVYFRDVRFLVQASLLLLFYATPVIYSADDLGPAGRWLDLNPLTGIVQLFQRAAGQGTVHGRAVVVSITTAVVLALVAVAAHRRHDRLFVDLL